MKIIFYYIEYKIIFNSNYGYKKIILLKKAVNFQVKGLEFPYVFICGLNEGIFPSKRTNTTSLKVIVLIRVLEILCQLQTIQMQF